MVTPDMILARLPDYRDEWELITNRQYVPDIIKEVCEAHKLFGNYYDLFSDLFYSRDPRVVSDKLFDFCRRYLKYHEEPVKTQTTALPTGIIERGYITGQGVDCKHYALFCAGVLGSLNRLYNCSFEAGFYFVGYGRASEPYHVYVCVKDIEVDIWLDPTPGSGSTPSLVVEKPV
jgi:hypothetical protein